MDELIRILVGYVVQHHKPFNVRDGKIKLYFTVLGAEDLSLEALLDHVDEALEEAKQLGRNQSVIAPVIQEGI